MFLTPGGRYFITDEQNEASELKKKKKVDCYSSPYLSDLKSLSLRTLLSLLQKSHTGTTLNVLLEIFQQSLDHQKGKRKKNKRRDKC